MTRVVRSAGGHVERARTCENAARSGFRKEALSRVRTTWRVASRVMSRREMPRCAGRRVVSELAWAEIMSVPTPTVRKLRA